MQGAVIQSHLQGTALFEMLCAAVGVRIVEAYGYSFLRGGPVAGAGIFGEFWGQTLQAYCDLPLVGECGIQFETNCAGDVSRINHIIGPDGVYAEIDTGAVTSR